MKTKSFCKTTIIGLALTSLAVSTVYGVSSSLKMTTEETVTFPVIKMTHMTPGQISTYNKVITPAGTYKLLGARAIGEAGYNQIVRRSKYVG